MVAACALAAVPDRPFLGPFGVVCGVAVAAGLVAHCVRRFRGITGDVLGAAVEIATVVAVLIISFT